MARFARVVVPDIPHHVTQRGTGRRDVFFNPPDRHVYLGLLKKYSHLYGVRVLGYCLMTNHVHLILQPDNEKSMAKALREVHGRYAQYRNAIEANTGHLWQNRYYSCPLEPTRLSSVLRYVELNPVRANLVKDAENYAWSSALIHLGSHDPVELVDLERWWVDWTVQEWTEVLRAGSSEAADIREATYRGRVLGSSKFVGDLERRLNRKLAPQKSGPHGKARIAAATP